MLPSRLVVTLRREEYVVLNRGSWLIALGVRSFYAVGWADPIVIGFESPSYTVGDTNGQQGWSKLGNYDAAVSSGGAFEGEQGLHISNGFTSGSFGDQTFTPHLDTSAGESTVAGSFDTFLASWYFKSVTGELQDGLSITVSADNGVGSPMTWVRMADDAGESAIRRLRSAPEHLGVSPVGHQSRPYGVASHRYTRLLSGRAFQ